MSDETIGATFRKGSDTGFGDQNPRRLEKGKRARESRINQIRKEKWSGNYIPSRAGHRRGGFGDQRDKPRQDKYNRLVGPQVLKNEKRTNPRSYYKAIAETETYNLRHRKDTSIRPETRWDQEKPKKHR